MARCRRSTSPSALWLPAIRLPPASAAIRVRAIREMTMPGRFGSRAFLQELDPSSHLVRTQQIVNQD